MNLLLLVLLTLGAGYVLIRALPGRRPELSPGEVRAAVESGKAVLVDVREPDEWSNGVAHPAALLPLSDLLGTRELWRPFLEGLRGRRILLYCRSGERSGTAASVLKAQGFDAVNVGRFSSWLRSGLPVRQP